MAYYSPVKRITCHELHARREKFDNAARMDDDPGRVSPAWRSADETPIDSDTILSDVYLTKDGSKGFFYSPVEEGGFTIYVVNMATFSLNFASERKQFPVAADLHDVCEIYANERISVEHARDAGRKGKGFSSSGLILYARNRSRSDSLVDYRKKMRDRQLPLKVDKQWQYFLDMAEAGLITAEAMRQVDYLTAEIEAARNGEPSPAPEGWSFEEARKIYITKAVAG